LLLHPFFVRKKSQKRIELYQKAYGGKIIYQIASNYVPFQTPDIATIHSRL
jgi:hypothetical protein